MAKKVIQVPLDEELLTSLTRLSRQRSQSRSQVIREACQRYLTAIEREELDRIYEEGYRRIPEGTEEEAWAEAGEAELSELLAEDSW